jgi:regulator of replication initiation timing
MEKNQIPTAINQVIDEVNDISALRANVEVFSELTQLKAENERLKEEISNFYSENINWFRLFNESHPEEVSYILTHKEI